VFGAETSGQRIALALTNKEKGTPGLLSVPKLTSPPASEVGTPEGLDRGSAFGGKAAPHKLKLSKVPER
jgi:hypothetical protein